MRAPGPIALIAVLLCLGGCGSAAEPGTGGPGQWLRVDAAHRHATITLATSEGPAAGGYNIDGTVKGALLFTVPAGWRVTVRCVNRSSEARYSCAVVPGPASGAPAPRPLGVAHPAGGLAPGGEASFSFTPARTARYRGIAVLGGREPAGMWVVVSITRGGAPSAVRLR